MCGLSLYIILYNALCTVNNKHIQDRMYTFYNILSVSNRQLEYSICMYGTKYMDKQEMSVCFTVIELYIYTTCMNTLLNCRIIIML